MKLQTEINKKNLYLQYKELELFQTLENAEKACVLSVAKCLTNMFYLHLPKTSYEVTRNRGVTILDQFS